MLTTGGDVMRVRTTADDELGILLVGLSGEPTRRSAAGVERVLAAAVAAGHRQVVLDLRELTDVDPALALVLLEADEDLTELGGWLWLVHGAGAAGSSLRFMGVHDRVPSSPTLAASGWAS
jgi:hypothetical protein